jgi:tRNA(fMet)-specific endonuclease VapC
VYKRQLLNKAAKQLIAMTGNKCLLDTSIIIHGFRSNNAISSQLDSIEAVFIPTIVIGELYFGAYKSSNSIKHIQQIDSFLLNSKVTVIQIDASIANAYGKIKSELAKKGKPIPENDIWIAAVAIQHNLPLFSTDNHFKEIDSLILL